MTNRTPQPIYRAPMRARAREAPRGGGAEFGIARGLVGIGESVDRPPHAG